MFNDPMLLLAACAVLVVLAILMFGIGTFAKGGAFNQRNANKIMRWRIGAQFFAVLLILLYAWLRSKG